MRTNNIWDKSTNLGHVRFLHQMSCINRQRLAECNEKGEGESAKMQRRRSDSSILLFRRRVFALWPLHFGLCTFALSHLQLHTLAYSPSRRESKWPDRNIIDLVNFHEHVKVLTNDHKVKCWNFIRLTILNLVQKNSVI